MHISCLQAGPLGEFYGGDGARGGLVLHLGYATAGSSDGILEVQLLIAAGLVRGQCLRFSFYSYSLLTDLDSMVMTRAPMLAYGPGQPRVGLGNNPTCGVSYSTADDSVRVYAGFRHFLAAATIFRPQIL